VILAAVICLKFKSKALLIFILISFFIPISFILIIFMLYKIKIQIQHCKPYHLILYEMMAFLYEMTIQIISVLYESVFSNTNSVLPALILQPNCKSFEMSF